MTTTIKSSALDFNAIKNNLKVYFEGQTEFADYDFEGSGLSNILDVLAYNTHLNALTANFAVNESFLGTAQLRESLVSLSESIGYIPASVTSSRCIVNLSVEVPQGPDQIFLPDGILFESSINGIAYTFQTLDSLEARNDGTGTYQFTSSRDGSSDIFLYEGYVRTKNFLVGGSDDNTVYVIPDANIDINTTTVKAFDTPSSELFTVFTDFKHATSITDNTRFYVLRESPNGNFDLSFGNGSSLGVRPVAGNKVEVKYLSSAGAPANGGSIFTPAAPVSVTNKGSFPLLVTTKNKSYAGKPKETIESIRFNAPFTYSSQNRMVTARDYAAVILERFPNLITDIVAWGGEDNVNPQFGVTYVSVLFNGDVSTAEKVVTKAQISAVVEQLSVLSFGLEFADPIKTFITVGVTFDFNSTLTSLPLNTVQANVRNALTAHFNTAVGIDGSFGRSFRLSNMLTDVDDVSTSVLSSAAQVNMQQRIVPVADGKTLNNFSLVFPTPIINADDVFYRVTSTEFTYNGKACSIKNKLSSTTLQIVSGVDVVVDAIGTYTPDKGKVNITGFKPTSISGGVNFIKISVVPANSNTITPTNNDVLLYDEDGSFVSGAVV